MHHANVSFLGRLPNGGHCYTEHRIDFAWVHWYHHIAADSSLALDQLAPMALDDSSAVGFIDPADILRGVHVIPRFAFGEKEIQVRSQWVSSSQKQYKRYYVNR